MLRIKLVKSPIGNTPSNRGTVQALGLRKINQVVEKPNTPMFQGMVHRIKHLLEVEIVEGEKKVTSKKVAKEKKDATS